MNSQNLQTESINLHSITASENNPRKTRSEENLAELSQSIKAHGVLQPVMLHRVAPDKYEVIYGERRCRAAAQAGLEFIPAIVRENLSKEQILEIALVENLMREEVSPIEECHAYLQLIEKSGYDVELLMARFSKSESYIRNRLRLVDLRIEFKDLLRKDVFNLTVAYELCKFSEETQYEIYEEHFAPYATRYGQWGELHHKAILSRLRSDYSSQLDGYLFDKSECYTCPHNTEQVSLFAETAACGHCTNRSCLKGKNTAYIVERAIIAHEQNPELPIARGEYNFDEQAVEILTAKGYEVAVVSYYNNCPTLPTLPEREEFDTDEEYEDATVEYGEEVAEYAEKSEEITAKYEKGEIKMFAHISNRGVALVYTSITTSGSSGVGMSPIEKLNTQDGRNKEIAIEKTIDDTKTLIKGLDVTQGDFTTMEEQILYFSMAKALRSENFVKVGFEDKHYLTDEDRWVLAYNLTEEKKTIIKRDFILSTLSDAQRGNYTAVMMFNYAEQHAQEECEKIKATHDALYEKRHTRIVEKIENLTKTTNTASNE
ncbi:MAG: ParB/RepB/Spo0J family partition protein [Rikenellaceae bacterium]